jgi:hypothetical protein
MTKINSWIVVNCKYRVPILSGTNPCLTYRFLSAYDPQIPKRLEDDLFLMSQLFKEDWQPQDLKPEDLICP